MSDSNEWFGEWFNSPYYHILYKNRDYKEAELFITNLTSKLNIPKQAHLLDLACGKGRHAIYLNTLGYTVTGLDLSEESIMYAKSFENSSLHFAVHDMRKPVKDKYNYVLNLFTSFGYFESENENIMAINSMANALLPNGLLIIDFMNVKKVIANLITEETKTIDNITFQIKREVINGYILKHISFGVKNKTYRFTEKVQALTEADFTKYLNFAGLKISQKYGDYQLNAFDATTSDRFILIATKA